MTDIATGCRCCPAGCGIIVAVEDGRVVEVRGDRDHPMSAGYTCAKGRGLPWFNTRPDRLDAPRLDGVRVDWSTCLDDLGARLRHVVAEGGPDAIASYTASGAGFDTLGRVTLGRFMAGVGSPQYYSSMSVDMAPVWRTTEMITGSVYELTPRWVPEDPASRLVLFVGSNPVVSHGYYTILPDPVRRMRAFQQRGGQVWVADPRATETAQLADHHLAIRPGSDGALLGWLTKAVLDSGAWPEPTDVTSAELVALRRALETFTIARVAEAVDLAESELDALFDAVRAARVISVVTGTGVTFSPHAMVTEWLRWALLIVTGSLDRPGGMWFDPGWLDPLPGRTTWNFAPADGRLDPGPRSRPELSRLGGQYPAAALVDEIESGTVRALIVAGGSPLTALPEPDRMLAALRSLDALVVMDVVETPLSDVATHLLPSADQLERTDILMYTGRTMMAPRAVPPAAERRPLWWMFSQLARRMGFDILDGLDPEEATDELLLERYTSTSPERFADLRRAGSHGLASPSGYGWVREHALPEGRWRLSQQRLLDRVPGLLEGVAAERPFVFVSRRQVRRLNSTQFASAPAPACIHLHPDDAVELGVGEGDLLEIHNDHGRTQGLPVRLDPTTRRGVVSVSHGWYGANVSRLVSTVQDLDPLTGQPVMSALRVSLHPSTDSGAPDEQKFR